MSGFTNPIRPFRWIARKRKSKGYGVHSPFAFDLITHVIHSPYRFYAFSDIPEIIFSNGFDPASITGFNRLSFRLVHYLKAVDILEVHSGTGVNSLFLTAPSPNIRCRCVEADRGNIAVAKRMQMQMERNCEIISSLPGDQSYDAIFINLKDNPPPGILPLITLSRPDTFWVLNPINRGAGKHFWDEIVHDVRGRITFDLKDTGIVFFRSAFHKETHFV